MLTLRRFDKDLGLQARPVARPRSRILPTLGLAATAIAVTVAYAPISGVAQAMPAGSGSAARPDTPTGTVLVPYNATGWKYMQTAHGGVAGFESPSYNDSAWPTGQAGFGSTNGPCSWNNSTYVHTPWTLNTDMLIRRHLTIPAGSGIEIIGSVDNTAKVYINGHDVQDATGANCKGGVIDVDVPASALTPDTVLAIRGTDLGLADYLDVQVTTTANSGIVVPYGAASWKYLQTAWGGVAGFQAPGFNDSAWPTGQAGFGTTNNVCSWNNSNYVKTPWTLYTDMLIRRHVAVPAGYGLQIIGAVDNSANVYVNGQDVQDATGGACKGGVINVAVPASAVTPDTVLAIRGHDIGVADYLDVQVSLVLK
jgi:hypothetical protein